MLGNQLTATDGEGFTTTFAYDDDSRLLNVSQVVSGNTLNTAYTYDIEESGVIKNRVTDAENHVTETWFDALGRKLTDFNDGDAGGNDDLRTDYTYYENGQVFLLTRNDGTMEKYTYTSLGQVERVDYYAAGANTSVDSGEFVAYIYDDNGQVHLETVTRGLETTSTTYQYDARNQLEQMIQDGLMINYKYTAAGRLAQVEYIKDSTTKKIIYDYDTYGRINYIKLQIGTGTIKTVRRYYYKANGDLDYYLSYRGFDTGLNDYIKTAFTINSVGLAEKITDTDYMNYYGWPITTKTEEYTMSYDKRGYITSETAYTYYNYTTRSTDKTYTYDSIGRLTNATSATYSNTYHVSYYLLSSTNNSYTYDKVGNRLTQSDGTNTLSYSYNSFNQLTTILKNGSAYASYTYDDRGNTDTETQLALQVTVNGTTTSYNRVTNYDYDLSNQLSALAIATPVADGQDNVTYTNESSTNRYNAAGQRVQKVENGSTTKYYYSGSSLLYTTDVNNNLLTENILDLTGTIIGSLRFDGTYAGKYYFYNYDARGSTTSIIAPDGTLTTGYTYDEFGNLARTGATSFINEVTFTGSVSDKTSKLQYMNARFYNPSTGRFLTQDTYSGNAYDPWTQHLYAYCGNNPTSMIDPTGHVPMYNTMMHDGSGHRSWASMTPEKCAAFYDHDVGIKDFVEDLGEDAENFDLNNEDPEVVLN